jgi:hypothetical protein
MPLPSRSIALLAVAAGCTTTVAYPGPRRPAKEVAVLENSETAIDVLDGQPFEHLHSQTGARYEVLPGRHAIGVSLFISSVTPGIGADIEKSDTMASGCLDAQAGHTYIIGHEARGPDWRPVITDAATRARVPFYGCPQP